MKTKLLLTCALLAVVASASAQISVVRKDYFEQRVKVMASALRDEYKTVKVGDTKVMWDTTSTVYQDFLSRADTNRREFKSRPIEVRKKNRILMIELTPSDYVSFRSQAASQDTAKFVKATVIRENKKKKDLLNVHFSLPLVSTDEKLVVVQEVWVNQSGEGVRRTNVYKNVDHVWVEFLNLEQTEISR